MQRSVVLVSLRVPGLVHEISLIRCEGMLENARLAALACVWTIAGKE